jgi:Uma2 family endonuclease
MAQTNDGAGKVGHPHPASASGPVIYLKRPKVRDYVHKSEEYQQVGIPEYWIVDFYQQQMTVFTHKRGRWTERIVRPPAKYKTSLLPGFEFDLTPIFEAAAAVPE